MVRWQVEHAAESGIHDATYVASALSRTENSVHEAVWSGSSRTRRANAQQFPFQRHRVAALARATTADGNAPTVSMRPTIINANAAR